MNAKRLLTHSLLLVLLWPVNVPAQNPCETCPPGSSLAFNWPAISAQMIVDPLFGVFGSCPRTPNTKCTRTSDQER
jgi:hypothetical protein